MVLEEPSRGCRQGTAITWPPNKICLIGDLTRGCTAHARPMLLLHAYLGVAPLSGRVARAEKQLASYYDDNYSSRITVGRRAQLGDEMVYRKGEYDPDLTYGEVRSRARPHTRTAHRC